MIEDLTPAEAARRLREQDPPGPRPVLVDVREGWERELAAVDGSVHLPMSQLPTGVADLPTDRPLLVLCHHGARSAQVASWLAAQGFDVANVAGGIDAWSTDVDPEVPRYG